MIEISIKTNKRQNDLKLFWPSFCLKWVKWFKLLLTCLLEIIEMIKTTRLFDNINLTNKIIVYCCINNLSFFPRLNYGQILNHIKFVVSLLIYLV